MRIYTDTMKAAEIFNAMRDCGNEATSVHIDTLDTVEKARKRKIRHDVSLYGTGARHTRKRNPGTDPNHNDRYHIGFSYAATYMDWGWFIAVLFRHEPTAIIGQYDGVEDFHDRVARRIRYMRVGNRPDPSVRTFAREFSTSWPNHLSDTNRDPALTESPFLLVDRLCPIRRLVNLNDPKAVSSWLQTA